MILLLDEQIKQLFIDFRRREYKNKYPEQEITNDYDLSTDKEFSISGLLESDAHGFFVLEYEEDGQYWHWISLEQYLKKLEAFETLAKDAGARARLLYRNI